jgi:hypothetical protein
LEIFKLQCNGESHVDCVQANRYGKEAEDQNWNCAGCGTFDKNAFCVTASIITSDPDAIDPKTGKKISDFSMFDIIVLLIACSFRANLVSIPIPEKIQSRNLVFPVFQIIRKETTDNLDFFAEVFHFFLSLEHVATGVDPDYLPFETHVSSGMSALWKVTGLGVGARGNVQFCTRCPVRSSRMHFPQVCPC